MRKNKISKLALLTGLLMINTTTKGFYQCVPKEDWFKKQYNSLMWKNKLETAKNQIDNEGLWKLVYNNQTSGNLDVGIYLVIVIGGHGGRGAGDSDDYKYPCLNKCYGGSGGAGDFKNKILFVKSKTSFTATIGINGTDAGSWRDFFNSFSDRGGDGTASSITIGNETIVAHAGQGGEACEMYYNCTTSNGDCEYKICHGKQGAGYNWGNYDYQYWFNIQHNEKIKIYKYIG